MKKTLLATLVASLGSAAGPPAYAEPGVMIGISHNFGGSTGVTLKLLSTREKNKAALAAGITYFPWTSGSPWGADVGLGYTFDRGALALSYDWLNEQFQLSLGVALCGARVAPRGQVAGYSPRPGVGARTGEGIVWIVSTLAESATDHPVAPATAAGSLSAYLLWPLQATQLSPEVLFWATIGTGVGLFMQPPGGNRLHNIGMALCFILLSSAFTVVALQFDTFSNLRPVAPLIAFLLAAGAQKLIPEAYDAVRGWMRRKIGGSLE